MSWPYGLNPDSVTYLVHRVPTVAEMQAALDKEDFVSRLVLDPIEPVQVASDTPPLFEWRGSLDGIEVTFRIGVSDPTKLPAGAHAIPGIDAWPIVLWSTRSGDAAVVGAGAMALFSWASATGGASVTSWAKQLETTLTDKAYIDFILSCASLDFAKMKAKYPDFDDTEPDLRGPLELTAILH